MIARLRHLARRTAESVGRRAPEPELEHWARQQLTAVERQLWDRFHPRDKRHSIGVARRFVGLEPDAPTTAIAGALLHDIGKIEAPSSVPARIAAELLGPITSGMARLREHEAIGSELLQEAGSDPVTIATAQGRGRWGPAVLRADDL